MFRQILVPLDGSSASFNALDQALHLASSEEVMITTLCIIDTRVSHEAHVYLPEENEIEVISEIVPPSKAAAIYRTWAEQVSSRAQARGQAAGVQLEAKIVSGIPYHEIISRSSHYDLLVLGRWKYASTYPGPFLAGSTPKQIIAGTRLPILCVFAQPRKPQTTLIAYDGSPAARDALQLSATLSHFLGGKLIALTVQQDGRLAQRLLREARIRAAPVVPRLVARDGNPEEVIPEIAVKHNCDLIALGVCPHQSLLRHSLGKLTDNLLRDGKLPLLLSH